MPVCLRVYVAGFARARGRGCVKEVEMREYGAVRMTEIRIVGEVHR